MANRRARRKKRMKQAEPRMTGVTLLREFEPHGGTIRQISFRPDGRQFVTASSDKTLKIWDTESGVCLRTLIGHESGVVSCDWSPIADVPRIVSGSDDATIRIWDGKTGECRKTLTGHSNGVFSTAWSHDGQMLVSGSYDKSIQIWQSNHLAHNSATKSDEHVDAVVACCFLADNQHVLFCVNREVHIWAPKSRQTVVLLCEKPVWSVSVHPRDGCIAAACSGGAIHIWQTHRAVNNTSGDMPVYKLAATLEGHTDDVMSCAFSPDGRLLASKSDDETVRLWRTGTWQTLAVLQETKSVCWEQLCFHPTLPILATPGENDEAVRLWELDYSVLLGDEPPVDEEAVHYTTARIALVGDSGVGKTGLGWRIAHGEFKEHESTHGQQFWVVDELGKVRDDGTQCEAVLWDFAGQPDFRLVHSLFLGQVDVGLLLFDPGRREKPLGGVEFWVKQLRHSERELLRTMLVAARCDVAGLTLTDDELAAFCEEQRISGGHIPTSAKDGDGIDDLKQRLRELIPWDWMSSTVTTATFKRIKDFVLRLKESRENESNAGNEAAERRQNVAPSVSSGLDEPNDGTSPEGATEDSGQDAAAAASRLNRVLIDPPELRAMLEADDPDWEFTDAEMMTAVGHLQSHGYVTICEQADGRQAILLFPDVLIGLAGSMVNAARGNSQGLGALIETDLDSDRYGFSQLDRLSEDDRETLIETAVRLFLQQHICFRESDVNGARTFLVFPSLINEKRPKTGQVETVESTSYHLEGAVETVYPALVVLLGYTDHFSRTNQWQNQAEYAFGENEVCGFRQITEHEGETELVLYFGVDTPPDARQLFQSLFERFLRGREVKVTRYAPIICQNAKCARQQERVAMMNLIVEGEAQAFCNKCGTKFDLPAAEEIASLPRSDDPRVEEGSETARLRTWFQTSLSRVKSIVRDEKKDRPSCFISYAWGVTAHEKWVHQLADDLRDAGIDGLLDIKHNLPGTDIDDYIENILETDFVVVVGTPKLLEKYNAKDSDPVVKAEMKLVNTRKMQPNRFGTSRIIPLMLDGEAATSLTPQLQNTVFVDFRDRKQYFRKLFALVLTLHGISEEHPGIQAVLSELKEPRV